VWQFRFVPQSGWNNALPNLRGAYVSTNLEQREIARLKRLLKRGPRLTKAERVGFLRALLSEFGQLRVETRKNET
jgi:hypothetical protein